MKGSWRHATVVLALSFGCAGDVLVDDPSLIEEESGTGEAGELAIRDGCLACAASECGWCAYEGENVYQCRGDMPPLDGGMCVQTGNVFQDEDGLYICWRCSP